MKVHKHGKRDGVDLSHMAQFIQVGDDDGAEGAESRRGTRILGRALIAPKDATYMCELIAHH